MSNEHHGETKNIPLYITVIGLFFLFYLIWEILDLPKQAEMMVIAERYFNNYGLMAVFLSAMLEGLFLFGLYFPGSFVVLLSVTLFGDDPNTMISIIFVVILGLLSAYSINFALGKYGWYKFFVRLGLSAKIEEVKSDLLKHGRKTILVSGWHPNFASITATVAGIIHVPFREYFYYSSISTIAWCLFWGLLACFFGNAILSFGIMRVVIILILLGLALRTVYVVFMAESHGESEHQ